MELLKEWLQRRGGAFGGSARAYGLPAPRFDEMFFVDLPDVTERAQIWDIVIKRHGRQPAAFDTVVLSRACEQFTGAEIEAVFIDALHEAYAEGREPRAKDILDAMTRTVPLAKLMDGQLASLRQWAKGRARETAWRIERKHTNTTPPRHGQFHPLRGMSCLCSSTVLRCIALSRCMCPTLLLRRICNDPSSKPGTNHSHCLATLKLDHVLVTFRIH